MLFYECIVPIFVIHYKNDDCEHIGSGVLIEIHGEVFLLTAAHVLDCRAHGTLSIPTQDGITSITGHVASICPSNIKVGQKDKLDIAYFKLNHNLVKKLDSRFTPLQRDGCHLTDNLQADDTYTFSGYPYRKTKYNTDKVETEIFSYTGQAAINVKYDRLGYDNVAHIIINFRRKKSVDTDGNKFTPPLPHGISGGGIFRWPKAISRRTEKLEEMNRPLVGIAHTYLKSHNCFIGTKLWMYLRLIQTNHPELFVQPEYDEQEHSMLPFIAIAAYRRDEWSELVSDCDDAGHMHNSWAEWRDEAEAFIELQYREGKRPIAIELSVDEIRYYCEAKSLPNTAKTRTFMATDKLMELVREDDLSMPS